MTNPVSKHFEALGMAACTQCRLCREYRRRLSVYFFYLRLYQRIDFILFPIWPCKDSDSNDLRKELKEYKDKIKYEILVIKQIPPNNQIPYKIY